MSSDPSPTGSDCMALALEFFREPSRFPDLLHGRRRLPPGVTTLLQAAAGNPFADGSGSDETQRAAQFFIEQVLLAHHANHYRVLGLEPGASTGEIKEHHRLLMRLFHPDRQTLPDERRDALATRINQAYNVLRSPDARTAYELTLLEKDAAKAQIKSRPRRPHFPPAADLPMHPPSFVTRHRTLVALGSLALVATLGVMLVYVNRVPTGAIGTGDSKFARATESEAARPAPTDLPPAIARALAEQGPADLPPAMATDKLEVAPPLSAEESGKAEAVAMPAALDMASAKPAPTPMVVPRRSLEYTPPARTEAILPPAPEASPGPVAVNAPAMPENAPVPLRTGPLNGLVAHFAEQYQRGDLESLLDLFDASAHFERGDKKQIRAVYGELFRNSESRVLYIWDVAWSGDGKLARGEGSFQARVLRKGERSPRITHGAVTIEVVQRNDRPLIVGLYHKAEN
jgi:hypothetical protein